MSTLRHNWDVNWRSKWRQNSTYLLLIKSMAYKLMHILVEGERRCT